MMTKIGVRQLSVPASELSIPSSAKQNKKAGRKLPSKPDRKTKISLWRGMLRMCWIVIGNNTSPAKTIRKAAIW